MHPAITHFLMYTPFAVDGRSAVTGCQDGNAWVSGGKRPTVTWILHTARGTGTAATAEAPPSSDEG